MSIVPQVRRRTIAALSAGIEFATGAALLVAPALVVALLLGTALPAEAVPLGRVAGAALLALGLACWPPRRTDSSEGPGFRALLFYNMLVGIYLAWLGVTATVAGVLLWPAAVVHAAIAAALIVLQQADG